MTDVHFKFEALDEDRDTYQVFLNDELLGPKTYSFFKKTITFKDDSAYEKLKEIPLRKLLLTFYSLELYVYSNDGTEIELDLSSKPYKEYEQDTFEYLKAESSISFDYERWKKPWSILDYFETHFSLLNNYPDIDTSCEIYSTDSNGQPLYDALNGVGLAFKLRESELDLTLFHVVERLRALTIELHEKTESLLNKENKIERCLEFPPQYYHAGLGILQFFNTYLREQYPDEQASVKIEQYGNKVRMIVESGDGKLETIEKALHEYELIISGSIPAQDHINNDKLLIELKSELRIAQTRIETQKDIIGLQNSRIDQLLNIVADALSNKNEFSIDIAPKVTISNTVQLNHYVSDSISLLSELQEQLKEPSQKADLNSLRASLLEIESEMDPTSVRHSSAMSKFKRVIEDLNDPNSSISKILNKLESGLSLANSLAKKYNAIAKWCALPTLPNGE